MHCAACSAGLDQYGTTVQSTNAACMQTAVARHVITHRSGTSGVLSISAMFCSFLGVTFAV